MQEQAKPTERTGAAPVRVTEHVSIPMPDGVRLAARLWLPEPASSSPVPALFEYIPYRKADMVRARDDRNHPYFAAHGYACLRVDMRGSGDSEGRMEDMYSKDELADARHVIDWIASQPWCDGQVGMFGTSWGGTASLQANVNAPEALKAIIAVCATHDRYEDDIHHKGGCLLTDTFEWGATLPAILAAPPTQNVGPDWMAMWKDRLAGMSFPVEAWVREEARGTYWRHGSVIQSAENLSRPTLAVGGWSDRYSNSVMSLVSARPDLVWGVVGPWGHHYPDHGHPGPAMGFQALALAWWDRWMRPSVAKQEDWPRLQVWLREFDPPANSMDRRNGQWIETAEVEHATHSTLWHLQNGALTQTGPVAEGGWSIPADLRIGQSSGDTGYFGRAGGLPLDQASEDANSLTFETEPLAEDLILYGAANASLELDTTTARQQVSLRLNDVAPDGQVARVAFAVRNLALDENLDGMPQQAATGRRSVKIPFHTKAYRFRKGHRIRLSLAASYWPLIWPSPILENMELRGGTLTLPRLSGQPNGLRHPLPPAEDLPEVKTHEVLAAPDLRRAQSTTADGTLANGWHQPFTEVLYPEIGTAFGFETRAEHSIFPSDPTSACSQFVHYARYARPDGTAEIHSSLDVSCDREHVYLNGNLKVSWNGEAMTDHAWSKAIGREYG